MCPDCGHLFPIDRLRNVSAVTQVAQVLSTEEAPNEFIVQRVEARVYEKIGSGKPPTLRVLYDVGSTTMSRFLSFSPEASPFARRKACAWWSTYCRTMPPATVDEAYMRRMEIPQPYKLLAVREGKYFRIVDEVFAVDNQQKSG